MRYGPALAATLVFAFVLAGCADTASEDSGGNSLSMSSADMGRKWPLTVESGVLACDVEVLVLNLVVMHDVFA